MVSVIIPVYNAGKYLKKCLASVLEQQEPDLQIILIDDGSTDDSLAICREFAGRDSRIQLVHQPHTGVCAARNRGLDLAKGEWVLFVDADDVLPLEAVSDLRKEAEDVDLVIGSHREFRWGQGKILRREPEQLTKEQCQERFPWFDTMLSTLWGKLYRRQVIVEHGLTFDASLSYCEDHVFNLQFCKGMTSAAVTSRIVYCYRLGGVASALRYHPRMERMCLTLLAAYQDFFAGHVPQGFWREKIQELQRACILHEINHQSKQAAVSRAEEIIAAFAPLMQNEGLDHALLAESLVAFLRRKEAIGIVIKKIRIALWRRYQKRI